MRLRWRLRAVMGTIIVLALALTVVIQAVRLSRAEVQTQRLRAEAEQARYTAEVARAEALLSQRTVSSPVAEEGQPAEGPAGEAGTTNP